MKQLKEIILEKDMKKLSLLTIRDKRLKEIAEQKIIKK